MKNPNPYFNVKALMGACLALAACIAVSIWSNPPSARAGQYDTALPLRTGTSQFTLPGLGGSNSWTVLPTTSTNGVIQTSTNGTGVSVNPGLVVAGTAAIQAEVGGTLTAIAPWTLGLSATGGIVKFTGTTWTSVP